MRCEDQSLCLMICDLFYTNVNFYHLNPFVASVYLLALPAACSAGKSESKTDWCRAVLKLSCSPARGQFGGKQCHGKKALELAGGRVVGDTL